ncbi:Heavy metal transport/detoxification superfamily protein, putative isoform 2 [Theobroma cacao]|uniref:Heavy metal transport/detoxification superfamily protein, putative isoform 2 n=1 Tax=Theobroma cacao TaxID=3641 RepID=A0A061GIG9_THECC|nr:Heavy metal transport/detoxification superfamily protein, putative isoform 2 [Theobroma cacao]
MVTTMELKVDLQCRRCYNKVKKLLSKFPQIRDQRFDEKANTVTITVVCCCPEKFRDKLCRKGGGSIKGIKIIKPSPPPPRPSPPSPPKPRPRGWRSCLFKAKKAGAQGEKRMVVSNAIVRKD